MRKHGMSKTRIYENWLQMIRICEKQSDPNYVKYGGRGIKVCNEWHDFNVFYEWAIRNGYNPSLSIDRIDVNGDYCPENCRWATAKMQGNNRRTNVYIEYNGRTQTMSEWADECGLPYNTFRDRYRKHGWDIERILTTPKRISPTNTIS